MITKTSGPKVHVQSVCRELGKLGHTVLLVQPKNQNPNDKNNQSLYKTLYLPNFVLSDKSLPRQVAIDILYALIIVIFRPQFIYERETGRRSFSFLSNFLRIPRIVELNGWTLKQNGKDLENEKYDIKRYKKDFKGAKAIVVSSPNLKNKILEKMNIEADIVHFIPNGVDIKRFSPPDQDNWGKNERTVIGYVGGFTYYQDIDTVIEAVNTLIEEGRQVELRMIGDYSPVSTKLENKIKNTNLSNYIFLLGTVEHKHIPEELWQMDICIAAYKRVLIETIGSLEGAMKLWEYWGSRRPVICTDLKTSSSYHHHQEKNYIAVEPENPFEMAEAIKFLIDNPLERKIIADRGYQYVKECNSWTKVASKIESIMFNE